MKNGSFGSRFFMSRDGLAENCSCIFCTSVILGGRMPKAQGTGTVPDSSSISPVHGGHAQERRMSRDGLADVLLGSGSCFALPPPSLESCIFCTSAIPGGRQITAPCVICTPAILGGRMPREVMVYHDLQVGLQPDITAVIKGGVGLKSDLLRLNLLLQCLLELGVPCGLRYTL